MTRPELAAELYEAALSLCDLKLRPPYSLRTASPDEADQRIEEAVARLDAAVAAIAAQDVADDAAWRLVKEHGWPADAKRSAEYAEALA